MSTKLNHELAKGSMEISEEEDWEPSFRLMVQAYSLPEPKSEWKFFPTRKWRFDRAWPDLMLAIEVNGGIYTQGRHSRGQGQLADFEKLNFAQIVGWRVLQFTPQQIIDNSAADMILAAIGREK